MRNEVQKLRNFMKPIKRREWNVTNKTASRYEEGKEVLMLMELEMKHFFVKLGRMYEVKKWREVKLREVSYRYE